MGIQIWGARVLGGREARERERRRRRRRRKKQRKKNGKNVNSFWNLLLFKLKKRTFKPVLNNGRWVNRANVQNCHLFSRYLPHHTYWFPKRVPQKQLHVNSGTTRGRPEIIYVPIVPGSCLLSTAQVRRWWAQHGCPPSPATPVTRRPAYRHAFETDPLLPML